jgi:hypothetical protein
VSDAKIVAEALREAAGYFVTGPPEEQVRAILRAAALIIDRQRARRAAADQEQTQLASHTFTLPPESEVDRIYINGEEYVRASTPREQESRGREHAGTADQSTSAPRAGTVHPDSKAPLGDAAGSHPAPSTTLDELRKEVSRITAWAQNDTNDDAAAWSVVAQQDALIAALEAENLEIPRLATALRAIEKACAENLERAEQAERELKHGQAYRDALKREVDQLRAELARLQPKPLDDAEVERLARVDCEAARVERPNIMGWDETPEIARRAYRAGVRAVLAAAGRYEAPKPSVTRAERIEAAKAAMVPLWPCGTFDDYAEAACDALAAKLPGVLP